MHTLQLQPFERQCFASMGCSSIFAHASEWHDSFAALQRVCSVALHPSSCMAEAIVLPCSSWLVRSRGNQQFPTSAHSIDFEKRVPGTSDRSICCRPRPADLGKPCKFQLSSRRLLQYLPTWRSTDYFWASKDPRFTLFPFSAAKQSVVCVRMMKTGT